VSAEDNKGLVRRLVREAVGERNLGVLDQIAAGEFAQIAKRWVSPFQSAFPDFEMEIVDLITEGEKVVARRAAATPSAASAATAGISRSEPRRSNNHPAINEPRLRAAPEPSDVVSKQQAARAALNSDRKPEARWGNGRLAGCLQAAAT
jgi:hypothetical protein